MPRHIKVFVSSPGDVEEERNAASGVLDDLQKSAPWQGKVTFQVIRWDDRKAAPPLDARQSFQVALNEVIPKPSACDLTVVIVWSRLGTRLADFHKSDGRDYASGTEWEFDDALTGSGPVFLFCKSSVPSVALDDPLYQEKLTQYEAVKAFVAGLATDGVNKHSYRTYSSLPHFKELFEQTIEGYLRQRDERGQLVQTVVVTSVLDRGLSELLKGIELVDDYKTAHDQLHRLQLECFNAIDRSVDRISEDTERWDELAEIVETVDDVVRVLEMLEGRFPPQRAGFKLRDIRSSADALRDSVARRDLPTLRRCHTSLASILRRFPSQVVVEMNDAAQTVTTGLATLRARRPSSALEAAEKRLADLVRSHDRWQRLDFTLATSNPQTQGADSWWPNVQDLAEPLVAHGAEEIETTFARVRAALEELGLTVAQNAPDIYSKFETLRARTGKAFSRVDTDLKTFCTELRRMDSQLSIWGPTP